jgi:adenosylmethionine-8-amino-7-oxononanoate aminotransferase
MTRLLHRQISSTLPVAIGGQGVEIYDSEGRTYLDACGGAAVSCLGHGHPDIIAALQAQMEKIAWVHTGFFTTEVAEELANFLVKKAPPGISHAYLVSGGSEAMEAAIKMARQYFVERGEPNRRYVIARRQSYHGNTLGALAMGGNAARRAQFQPLLIETHHIDPCYAYRHQQQGESDEAYAARAAQSLEDKILELGPDNVLAFLAETVVGATAGAVPPVANYFKRVREICDRHGVLLVLDEVMCGMGRTGTLFACEQEGISPDLIAIAKGLGGGYQPVGALLLGQHLYDTFARGSGTFQSGHTYLAHPMTCAAALAVQQVIERDQLLARVRKQGEFLQRLLESKLADHPHVGDIRGRGLFRGIELVMDRDSKEPFDPSLKLYAKIKREALARGLIVYPMGGTHNGSRGDHVLLAPPYIITEHELEAVVDRLTRAMNAAIRSALAT